MTVSDAHLEKLMDEWRASLFDLSAVSRASNAEWIAATDREWAAKVALREYVDEARRTSARRTGIPRPDVIPRLSPELLPANARITKEPE